MIGIGLPCSVAGENPLGSKIVQRHNRLGKGAIDTERRERGAESPDEQRLRLRSVDYKSGDQGAITDAGFGTDGSRNNATAVVIGSRMSVLVNVRDGRVRVQHERGENRPEAGRQASFHWNRIGAREVGPSRSWVPNALIGRPLQ